MKISDVTPTKFHTVDDLYNWIRRRDERDPHVSIEKSMKWDIGMMGDDVVFLGDFITVQNSKLTTIPCTFEVSTMSWTRGELKTIGKGTLGKPMMQKLDLSGTKIENLVGSPSSCRVLIASSTPISTFEGFPSDTLTVAVENCKSLTSLHNIHKHLKACTTMRITGSYVKDSVLGLMMIHDLKNVFGAEKWGRLVNDTLMSNHTRMMDKVLVLQEALIEEGLDDYAKM